MPLSDYSKSQIQSAISHLLEFSSVQEVNELNRALTGEIGADHDYYWLKQCLFHPAQLLIGLEKQQQDPFSVAEVQLYIVALINNALEDAKKKGVDTQGWDEKKVLALLNKEDSAQTYESALAPVDGGPTPWALPELPDKIYTQRFHISESGSTAIVTVKVNCTSLIRIRHVIRVADLPAFDDDDEQDDFMEGLKRPAAEAALDFAARTAIEYIKTQFPFTSRIVNTAMVSDSIKKLVTTEYYFSLLKQGKLTLARLISLKPNAELLSDGTIINLMQHGIFGLDAALALTPDEKRVICNPFYAGELLAGRINLEDLSGVSEAKSKFLILPPVINLIMRQRLNVSEAGSIIGVKELFISPLYLDYFQNEQIDWAKLRTLGLMEFQLLLDSHFAALIKNNVFHFNDTLNLPYRVTGILYFNRDLIAYLEKKLQAGATADPMMLRLNISLFAKRLFAIYNGTPCNTSSLSHPDNVNGVNGDMIIAQTEFPFINLRDAVIQELIMLISDDIKEKISGSDPHGKSIRYYEKLERHIDDLDMSQPQNWSDIFAGFLHAAEETNARGTSFFTACTGLFSSLKDTLFQPSHKRKAEDEEEVLNKQRADLLSLGEIIMPDNRKYSHIAGKI